MNIYFNLKRARSHIVRIQYAHIWKSLIVYKLNNIQITVYLMSVILDVLIVSSMSLLSFIRPLLLIYYVKFFLFCKG